MESGCDACGYIYPVNTMRRVSDRVKTGQSTRYSRDSQGHERQSGHTDHFANRTRLFCDECYRRRRKMQLLGFGALALVGVGVVGANAMTAPRDGSVAPAVTSNFSAATDSPEPIMQPGEALPEAAAEPTSPDAEPASQPGVEQPAATAREEREDVAEPPAPAPAPAAVALSDLSAVQEAGRKALASGRAERWHEDGMRGYAVPSEQAVNGCRSVTFSEDKGTVASVTTELCQ